MAYVLRLTALPSHSNQPVGAEGPIIWTGGALGSLAGQWLSITPSERKILLASGAAAGMAAIFGTPLAAVVLAIGVGHRIVLEIDGKNLARHYQANALTDWRCRPSPSMPSSTTSPGLR